MEAESMALITPILFSLQCFPFFYSTTLTLVLLRGFIVSFAPRGIKLITPLAPPPAF
jgi:hypothetical protein